MRENTDQCQGHFHFHSQGGVSSVARLRLLSRREDHAISAARGHRTKTAGSASPPPSSWSRTRQPALAYKTRPWDGG